MSELSDKSLDQLIRLALNDDDARSECISEICNRCEPDIVSAAEDLCDDFNTDKACIGADILALLCKRKNTLSYYESNGKDTSLLNKVKYYHASKLDKSLALGVFRRLLRKDFDADILCSALNGMKLCQSLWNEQDAESIISLSGNHNDDVRLAIAKALLGREDMLTVDTLLTLMEDSADEVRDWATFGIGTEIHLDTDEIRDALWKRVCEEEHWDAYCEAIYGLARRKDEYIWELILEELEDDDPTSLIFKAAAEIGDPRLLEPMRKHVSMSNDIDDLNEGWLEDLLSAIDKLEMKIKDKP